MYNIETQLAQIGNRSESLTGTVSPPIYLSTAFRHEGIGQSTGFDYIRTGSPTRKLLEEAIAALEEGDAGFACSSGMGAIYTVLSLFQSGDEFIVSNDLYGGTYRIFEGIFKKFGLSYKFVDTSNIKAVEKVVSEKTAAIFLETPTNPLMQESDIAAVANIAKQYGTLLIVDNTFYTPYMQKPILLGADIVIHSGTKYLGGHNDIMCGLIVSKGKELSEKLKYTLNATGATLSPFDSWLMMRGMKTLALRMKKHDENAKKIVAYLETHKGITEVLYTGKGGMLSFKVKDESWVNPFLQSLQLICFAESLGGLESFITYPATQTHAEIPVEIRTANGVCNRLLRFSVGIEETNDIIQDLEQALSAAQLKIEGE